MSKKTLPTSKAKPYAVAFLRKATKSGERPTHAVRKLLKRYPKLQRPEVAQSAGLAGMNRLTARNVWDSINRA